MTLVATRFPQAFAEFRKLYEAYGGHAFQGLHEGFAQTWESYKVRLRSDALKLLALESWTSEAVGSGRILAATIKAIELPSNNLVFWRNRFGHDARDHAALLDASHNAASCLAIEKSLFDLYVANASEPIVFEALATLTRRKYPLLAYLFFLKDAARFMPIQPTGFDRAFAALGIDLKTLGQCGFKNYQAFNTALASVAKALERNAAINQVPLIDAHSFCWIYATLLKIRTSSDDGEASFAPHAAPARSLKGRELSISEMKYSIIHTAQQARGQTVVREISLKRKDLCLDTYALERHLRDLLDRQQNRCNVTGIPFSFKDEGCDENLLPSADRIDSNEHYAEGNLQIVCRFVNFWKRDTPNETFLRLLALVRGESDLLPTAALARDNVQAAAAVLREIDSV